MVFQRIETAAICCVEDAGWHRRVPGVTFVNGLSTSPPPIDYPVTTAATEGDAANVESR